MNNSSPQHSEPADFYLAGASKSGTTSLFQVLRGHPQLFFPVNKEPHYFSWGMDEKPTGYSPRPETSHCIPTSSSEYRKLFVDARPDQLRGDASACYIFHPEAPKRIASIRPDARIIFILRHPVQRAYSAFHFFSRDGREPAATLQEAITPTNCTEALSRKEYYLEYGLYGQQLQRYLNHFPKSQIQIHLYEELVHETEGVVREIYQFLEIDDSDVPKELPKLNRSGTVRSTWLRDLVGHRTMLHDALRILLPLTCRTKIREILEQINTTPSPTARPEAQDALIEFYREDIRLLESLTHRDLSHWLTE